MAATTHNAAVATAATRPRIDRPFITPPPLLRSGAGWRPGRVRHPRKRGARLQPGWLGGGPGPARCRACWPWLILHPRGWPALTGDRRSTIDWRVTGHAGATHRPWRVAGGWTAAALLTAVLTLLAADADLAPGGLNPVATVLDLAVGLALVGGAALAPAPWRCRLLFAAVGLAWLVGSFLPFASSPTSASWRSRSACSRAAARGAPVTGG